MLRSPSARSASASGARRPEPGDAAMRVRRQRDDWSAGVGTPTPPSLPMPAWRDGESNSRQEVVGPRPRQRRKQAAALRSATAPPRGSDRVDRRKGPGRGPDGGCPPRRRRAADRSEGHPLERRGRRAGRRHESRSQLLKPASRCTRARRRQPGSAQAVPVPPRRAPRARWHSHAAGEVARPLPLQLGGGGDRGGAVGEQRDEHDRRVPARQRRQGPCRALRRVQKTRCPRQNAKTTASGTSHEKSSQYRRSAATPGPNWPIRATPVRAPLAKMHTPSKPTPARRSPVAAPTRRSPRRRRPGASPRPRHSGAQAGWVDEGSGRGHRQANTAGTSVWSHRTRKKCSHSEAVGALPAPANPLHVTCMRPPTRSARRRNRATSIARP